MQQSVSIRRPLLVSGRYVLVNIILDMSLAYGLTTRPRANTIIDTVTYLVDESLEVEPISPVNMRREGSAKLTGPAQVDENVQRSHTSSTASVASGFGGFL